MQTLNPLRMHQRLIIFLMHPHTIILLGRQKLDVIIVFIRLLGDRRQQRCSSERLGVPKLG